MIIDFHTHVFPDKIAARTIELLSKNGGIPAHSDGTVDGLVKKLEEAGVDIAITLPVVTNPAQFDSINRFAASINETFADKTRRLISFGGIHPDCEDIEGKMKLIKSLGLLGVKLHPDYQGRFINDERYVRILECARDNDLIVLTHTGYDGAFVGQPMKCTPPLIRELIRKVPYSKLVLAHLGSNEMMNESYEMLAGEDVYFDTAYMLPRIDSETFRRLVKKHGEDRVLFATDSPWTNIKDGVERLRSFSLGEEAEEKIFSKNARALLGI